MFKGIRVWGVIAGFVVDLAWSLSMGLALGIGVSIFFAIRDQGNPALISMESHAVLFSITFRIFGYFLGSLGSFLGGFVSSWIGSAAGMKNVLCVMILELVLDCVLIPLTYEPPLWLNLLGVPIGLSAVYLGGLFAKKIL